MPLTAEPDAKPAGEHEAEPVAEPDSAEPAPSPARSDRRRKIVGSAIAIVVAAIPFLLALWNFGIRPTRTAVPSRLFSQFYDIQAEAFLDGNLHVPDGSLGIEGFRHDGHEYLYFGPLPALLRLPLTIATDSMFGRLSAPSMLAAWCLGAVFVAATVWRVRAIVTPDRDLRRGELMLIGLLILVLIGGSPTLIIAALPWVYSEALMWALATSMGALFGVIGLLERPSAGRIAFTALLTTGAVLSRVTAGWGVGLAVLGGAALFAFAPGYREYRRWASWTLVAGVLPLAVGIAVNWAKFRHPVLIPFDDQVWTDLSARRQQVLEEGGVTGVRFVPSTVVNYLRPDGIAFSSVFPFVGPPVEPAGSIGSVNLDMRYRTPSATPFMPLLFLVGLYGSGPNLVAGDPPRAGDVAGSAAWSRVDRDRHAARRLHRAPIPRRVRPVAHDRIGRRGQSAVRAGRCLAGIGAATRGRRRRRPRRVRSARQPGGRRRNGTHLDRRRLTS